MGVSWRTGRRPTGREVRRTAASWLSWCGSGRRQGSVRRKAWWFAPVLVKGVMDDVTEPCPGGNDSRTTSKDQALGSFEPARSSASGRTTNGQVSASLARAVYAGAAAHRRRKKSCSTDLDTGAHEEPRTPSAAHGRPNRTDSDSELIRSVGAPPCRSLLTLRPPSQWEVQCHRTRARTWISSTGRS